MPKNGEFSVFKSQIGGGFGHFKTENGDLDAPGAGTQVAAWLDPTFELWVYVTIDYILFGHYREMEINYKESAKRRNRIAELERKLMENEIYLEMEELQAQERRAGYVRGKKNREQITMFRDFFFNEDMKAAKEIPDASSD